MIDPNLPGAEIVAPGLVDLRDGKASVEALLVSMARPKLIWLGLDVPEPLLDPEMTLFHRLMARDPECGYRDYNSLRRRLDRFCRALEHQRMSALRALHAS